MEINSKKWQILEKAWLKPFDWETNNCALFCASVYSQWYNRPFKWPDAYNNKYQFSRIIITLGWPSLLRERGLLSSDKLQQGHLVIGEDKTLGIYDGDKVLYAGQQWALLDDRIEPVSWYALDNMIHSNTRGEVFHN